MSTESAKPERSPKGDPSEFARMAVWLLRTQALLAVAAAIVTGLAAGVAWSLAVLAGAAIGIVLTAVSALRTGAVSAEAGPAAMAAAFYRGMMLKMALAVVMFVIVAALFAEWFVPVLIGYGVTLVAYWVALLKIGRGSGGNALNDE
ncbi:MAG: ATP synthase subunit I [Candidatus Wenzhouxiangella sp. M2_3B_020]